MKKLLLGILGISMLTTSCNNNDDESTTSALNLDITGLEDLGSDYVYEGWAIVNGEALSTGRFSVNSMGELSQTSFVMSKSQLNATTTFILTIEPAVGDVPEPSSVHILAGNFSGNAGTLSVSHSAAFGNDFTNSTGKFIMATPTDGGSMDNEESGVWFLDNSGASPVAGLSLPVLPSGWKYEGWAVINGTPVSTGTFTSVSGIDDNGMFSGTTMSPPFPGEDFLQAAPMGLSFPTDLRGKTIVISVEPSPDNSPAPFSLKPLVKAISAIEMTHSVVSMDQNLNSLPTGSFFR
jgi:hypothetical protein